MRPNVPSRNCRADRTAGWHARAMTYTIRAVRAHEWREIRALRLAALQDEVAAIAFLDTWALHSLLQPQ